MDAEDAFTRAMQIARSFERESFPYAIGGALALGVWGVPRGTVDVAVNVFVEPDQVGDVVLALTALGIAVDPGRAASDVRERGMFVGNWDGMRIDVFTSSIDFSYEALRTRKRLVVAGTEACYLSAESVAVFKLLFFRSKDVADLERLVAVADVDAAYVRRWMVRMMGEDDERVRKWDEIVATFGTR